MLLSVVVTIVDGGTALKRCLEALCSQKQAPPMEVLVPYDDSVPSDDIRSDMTPRVAFVPLGTLHTDQPKASALGQHELIDRRRAAGLAVARGELVAIVEDRGVPREDWAAAFVRIHSGSSHSVIGGAIENGTAQLLNWAVYFCDFGRYQRPFRARLSRVASDVNVCYKRERLESVKSSWTFRFHEPVVHGALVRAGETIFLSPDPVVDQIRGDLRLGTLCRERLGWGRLYADLRLRDAHWFTRPVLLAASPLLPLLLFVRVFRDRLMRPRTLIPFLAAAPSVAVLLCAWSAGEALGYLVGPKREVKSET
jgi:hypothetical protein